MERRKKREDSSINLTTSLLIIAILLLVVILIVIIVLLLVHTSGFGVGSRGIFSNMINGNYSSMMNGGYSNMMNGGGTGQFGTHISIVAAESNESIMPYYVHKYANNNTLAFSSRNITLVVLAMGVQRAINLTHEQPPQYDSNSSGNAFVIYGLINPTLIIPKDAIVHVEFINLDSSEYHNVIMTAAGPPYQYMPMSAMGGLVSMMPFVQHADYQQGQAYEYSYNASFSSAGTFWYLCMYPGHAQMGMYGKIIVG